MLYKYLAFRCYIHLDAVYLFISLLIQEYTKLVKCTAPRSITLSGPSWWQDHFV